MDLPMVNNERKSLSGKIKNKPLAIAINAKFQGRSLTLISITLLLNILLWSSAICLGVAIYQIASDPYDLTNVPSEILTLTSACLTIFYTILHTIISLKQRVWLHRRRDQSAIKRTSYIAVRIVVTVCVFWLLTSGWNMIMVARRPSCLPQRPQYQAWEIGLRCGIARLGMAFAMLATVVSIVLFIMLASVSRPFEAHLFRCSLQQAIEFGFSPSTSSKNSPARRGSLISEKHARTARRSVSGSTHYAMRSRYLEIDIETLDLNISRPPSIYAPSPQRSFSMGIFTSDIAPPAMPSAYATPPRVSSLDPPPSIFHPSISHQTLTLPPCLSGSVGPSLFRPTSAAPQYAASTWRAVHPERPALRRTSRSNPHLSSTALSYRNRYSRSSLSLTKPQRLASGESKSESVTGSSRSDSIGPVGRESQISGQTDGERNMSTNEDYHAITNDFPVPSNIRLSSDSAHHKRIFSAPDTTSGAEDPRQSRMAKGWKPHTKIPDAGRVHSDANPTTPSDTPHSNICSPSGTFLSRFSPSSSPEHSSPLSPGSTTRVMQISPYRHSRSVEPVNAPLTPASVASVAEAAAQMISRMPADLKSPLKSPKRVLHSPPESRRRMENGVGRGRRLTVVDYEGVINKPLPKIARL